MKRALAIIAFGLSILGASASEAKGTGNNNIQHGKASWYSISTNGGTHTASGKRLRDNEMTAAHRTLPFGSLVKVTNKKNGKSVNVIITNRGPFIKGRIIDVTVGAAEVLGFKRSGLTTVELEVLRKGK